MAFWDFLSRLLGKGQPSQPTPEAATPAAPARSGAPDATRQAVSPAAKPQAAAALQASDFLPISRDELVEGGEEVRRTTGWMWFGRRDIIPPATDPRTKLIDRGMLTQGLLAAEQLAEMHTVGEQHDKFANREHHINVKASLSAEEAVEADRAARKERKELKKAEAAQRKWKRQEAIAFRKANDICFVGKGVSALLNDRESDVSKLAAMGLPVLHTPIDLAAALGLTIPKLRWLCFHTEVATRIHYVQFEVPKRSGGTRTLSAPHRTIAAAQQWALANILAKLPVEPAAHGFVPGRSTLTNARPHAGKAIVVNLDLEGFFPSIGFPRVRHLYRRLGYSGAVATLLALLCTECPRKQVIYDRKTYFVATGRRGLPQGACTSPALSNQISRRLDRRLSGLSAKLGLNYTRYADDLTFSSGGDFSGKLGYLLARVRHIAQDEGFAVNPKKTRVKRLHARQTVTGLVVNDNPGVPRDLTRRLRAILHRAKAEGLAAQNRHGEPNFRAWVEGMIAYIAMSRPAVGEKLRRALSDIAR
jgi:RNA-directed DNA polymerase